MIDLRGELDALEAMSRAELRAAWNREVRTTPPNLSGGLLRLALAHHLESKVLGGVTKAMERKLQEIADSGATEPVTPGISGAQLVARTPDQYCADHRGPRAA